MSKNKIIKIGKCRLCKGENVELHKDSHIFPAFMVRNIKPEHNTEINQPLFVGTDSNHELTKLKVYNYSGEFERFIFCKSCELKLAKLDDWGAKFFTHKTKGVSAHHWKKGFRELYLRFDGLNYKSYKLFILSLFVRTSVSDRPGLNFKLNEEAENLICQMIVNDDAGDEFIFPISKFLLSKPPGLNKDRLYYPISISEKHSMFFFSDKNNAGMVFVLNTSHSINPTEEILKADGTFNALCVDDFATGSFYLSFLNTELNEYFSDLPNINFVGIGVKPTGDQLRQMMESEGTMFDQLFIHKKVKSSNKN